MTDTVRLTEALIARASVTPLDGGCQDLMAERLRPLGFECHTLVFGPQDAPVTNLWAIKRGRDAAAPVLAFAGHTDVVPTGPLDQWSSPPFVPTYRDGLLYGRGAADMKTSLAAMVVATEAFVARHPDHAGSIAFLITSDEEGPSVDGTVKVCEWLQQQGQRLDACIVGEPTSVKQVGDMIKNGRRGSLSGKLRVKGVQGHIAYPHLAKNPIHLLAPALAELVTIVWDQGNDHFPPTTWQCSNIHAGTGANNVIPGEVVVDFNFRFSTESTPEGLQKRLEDVLRQHGLDFHIDWTLGGRPFLTRKGPLVDAISAAIEQVTGVTTELSTTGGTSDGRFIAQMCPQVVEFGPVNASIHKIDEHVRVADIEPLKDIYLGTLERLLA
ncbi:succinyl-diaminopimelate desuccinylase [Aquabacterium fontiphilum]|uniref:succinyl-diaminopimelate desuccinylase n=1 Tax=Aquabacterium fontiphilum TaxID=450365 RepID=UPI001377A0ED|nr:succinyl-diaminopimelate desuccinylase [Aquabacterium fontiphilum]NBD19989.1 succinyl-diaminopimelate desuccinylase [Aquabacterium fontiphilum]